MADLERQLLAGDLDLLQSDIDAARSLCDDVDDYLEDREYRQASHENKLLLHKLTRLARDHETFKVRWEELRTANVQPGAQKLPPDGQ